MCAACESSCHVAGLLRCRCHCGSLSLSLSAPCCASIMEAPRPASRLPPRPGADGHVQRDGVQVLILPGTVLPILLFTRRGWKEARGAGCARRGAVRVCAVDARCGERRGLPHAVLVPRSLVCCCFAAIMSVCHKLALRLAGIDGGGGARLDCTHTQALS